MMIDFQTSSTTSISKCKLRTTHPWSSPHKSGWSYVRFRVQNPKLQPNIFVRKAFSFVFHSFHIFLQQKKTGKVWTSLELDLAYHWMIQKSGKISLHTAPSCDPFVFYSEDSLTKKKKNSVPCMTFLFTAFCSMFIPSYDILLREIWQLLHCAKFLGDPMRGGLYGYMNIYTHVRNKRKINMARFLCSGWFKWSSFFLGLLCHPSVDSNVSGPFFIWILPWSLT